MFYMLTSSDVSAVCVVIEVIKESIENFKQILRLQFLVHINIHNSNIY